MNLRFSQFTFLRRHLVYLAIIDHGHDCIFTPPVQPDVVGQVRGAESLITFSIHAMAGSAGAELAFPQGCLDRIVRAA